VDPSTSTSQIGSNYLSLAQAARQLRVSQRMVRDYVYRGWLRAIGGGHGRPLYFHPEDVAAFRAPRRGPRSAGFVEPAPGPDHVEQGIVTGAADWLAVLGAEEMARILAKPVPKQAAAFERAVRARAPHLVGALEARYPTLSGSTIKRTLRRELPDQLFRDDEEDAEGAAFSLIDIAYAQSRQELDGAWGEDVPVDADED
jgi:Helix-turn-helix domain